MDRPIHIYLDTNAFRYFGVAFKDVTLPMEVRERVLHSPLSAFEVMKQLADLHGDAVLKQIHAIRNWTNPAHAGLLPFPSDALRSYWFGTSAIDEGFRKGMQESFNVLLNTDSADDVLQGAIKHKEFMVKLKLQAAQDFQAMLEYAKKNPFDMTTAWFQGIANGAGADPNSKPATDIQSILSALYEYEQSKLATALKNPKYNPMSLTNQNDIIDAEQLIYLADESLYFLTCDQGFQKRIKKSPQATRIITAKAEELQNPITAEALLRKTANL